MVLYENFDDFELLRMSRAGDNSAFAELLMRYSPMINKAISRFSSHSISHDEAFNEASVALHKATKAYDPTRDNTFGAFAKVCVNNRLHDLFLKTKQRDIPVDIDGIRESGDMLTPSPMDRLLIKEKQAEIFALARDILGSGYEFSVFELYFNGYDTDAMCRALSRERKSVENAKARMLKKLRDKSERFSSF